MNRLIALCLVLSVQDSVRAQLERRYAENAAAFMKWDVPGIMALRAADFHTVGPDGTKNDRAAMERYTQATQREIWIRSGPQWSLWQVDSVRNQRRLIDGK